MCSTNGLVLENGCLMEPLQRCHHRLAVKLPLQHQDHTIDNCCRSLENKWQNIIMITKDGL